MLGNFCPISITPLQNSLFSLPGWNSGPPRTSRNAWMSEAHLSDLPWCCRCEKFSLMFSQRKGRREGWFLSRACVRRQEARQPFSLRPDEAGPRMYARWCVASAQASSARHLGTSGAWRTGSLWDPLGTCAARQHCAAALRRVLTGGTDKEKLEELKAEECNSPGLRQRTAQGPLPRLCGT